MKLAIVRVRGLVGVRKEIRRTLEVIGLDKRNSCVVLEDNPSNLGALERVKDFVTWGPVDDKVLAELKKRGEGRIAYLNSPSKGYGRHGIKVPFRHGGALGNRGEKINDLILRML